MSRNYQEVCRECRDETARTDYINDFLKLEQCLSCGVIFKITTTIEKLTSKGISESAWEKAVKEALRKKAAVSPSREPQTKGGEE